MDKNEIDLAKIREHSTRMLAGGALAGSLLLSSPGPLSLTAGETRAQLTKAGYVGAEQLQRRLAENLKILLPEGLGHAGNDDEKEIEKLIEAELGIKATPELDGNRLNHSIGYMGYEQHLKRYPGDTIAQHDEVQQAGIAPGLGAYGYFTYSKDAMSQEDYLKEKYYLVVQTMYMSNWNTDHRRLVPWFKHRKMIAINPETGAAVVGVLGDAGPAKWTGKQFGGSPEVMTHLGLVTGKKKGKVLLYFVDDPENKIPMGPVETNYKFEDLKVN